MATAYHVVHYRSFVPPSGEKRKLEELCRIILDQQDGKGAALWNRVVDRIQKLDSGGSRQLVLNKVADLSSAVFGELCLVDTAGLQALLRSKRSTVELSDKTKAEVFDLDERKAPDGSQFLRGMAYWLSIGNHLFYVKTQGTTPDHIRGYFDWLLKANPKGVPRGAQIVLQAEFDKSQVPRDIGDIRTLRVKGNATRSYKVDTVDEEQKVSHVKRTARTVADRLVEFQQALPVIRALLGSDRTDSLVKSLGPDEYLAVDASVKVRGRRTEESKANMRKLANDMADLTDATVQIEGRDGKLSDGDAILRTTMPFDLPHEGSNLLDFNNVADQLQEVYVRYVKDGKLPK